MIYYQRLNITVFIEENTADEVFKPYAPYWTCSATERLSLMLYFQTGMKFKLFVIISFDESAGQRFNKISLQTSGNYECL
jgi:hypothetical protein